MFRKLYANVFFRLPFKFTIAFVTTKIAYDLFFYLIQGNKFGLARFMQILHGQNPINPPNVQPYPYSDNYQHLKNIRLYHQHQININESLYKQYHIQTALYNDHPCRQNPDVIDHFIEYGNIYKIHEYINYTFINKLKSQGIQIPQGINQRIRQLEQYRLDRHQPIVPLL